MVTKEYLLTSSEKDDYTATEDTGVSLGSQNRKKKINNNWECQDLAYWENVLFLK